MSYGRQQYGSYGRHGAGNHPPRRPWETTNEEDKKETAQYQNKKPQAAKQWPAPHQARINSKYQDDEDDNQPEKEEKEACAYNYKPPSRQYYGGSSSSSSSSAHNEQYVYKPAGGGANCKSNIEQGKHTAGSSSSTDHPSTATTAPRASSKYTLTEDQMYPRSRPIQPYINNAEDDDEEEETGEDLVNELLTLSPRGQHVIPRKPGDPRFGNTKIVVEDLHLFMDNNEIEDFQWNRKY